MGGRRGGKDSRAKSKLRRKKERTARKASRQAQYERWRDLGINTKSKRQVKKGRKGPRMRRHAIGNCGNPGCIRCFGVGFGPFLDKLGAPFNMPHWMWRLWVSV